MIQSQTSDTQQQIFCYIKSVHSQHPWNYARQLSCFNFQVGHMGLVQVTWASFLVKVTHASDLRKKETFRSSDVSSASAAAVLVWVAL